MENEIDITMRERIFTILSEVLKAERKASKEDAERSMWVGRVNHFAYYPNKERFKSRYLEALKSEFSDIVPDENAISFIVDKEVDCAFLAEQMGKEHSDPDDLEQRLNVKTEELMKAKNNLAANIIVANQMVSVENGIDESLLEILRINGFGGGFVDPTLNYAYQSYCEILRLQQENGEQQQALTQGTIDRKELLGIVDEGHNECYTQHKKLIDLIELLEEANAGIAELSTKLKAEKAKGFFSKLFEKFRKIKYLPGESTGKEDTSLEVSPIITKIDSIVNELENTEENTEGNTEVDGDKYRKNLKRLKAKTTSEQTGNFSLQFKETDSSTDGNTPPAMEYAKKNVCLLEEKRRTNEGQRQEINTVSQDIEKLFELINGFVRKYNELEVARVRVVGELRATKQKIEEISDKVRQEEGKTLFTRAVEAIKRIGASAPREDELPDKESSAIDLEVITNLQKVAKSYSPILEGEITEIRNRVCAQESRDFEQQELGESIGE